jgi:hypothetical protein
VLLVLQEKPELQEPLESQALQAHLGNLEPPVPLERLENQVLQGQLEPRENQELQVLQELLVLQEQPVFQETPEPLERQVLQGPLVRNSPPIRTLG